MQTTRSCSSKISHVAHVCKGSDQSRYHILYHLSYYLLFLLGTGSGISKPRLPMPTRAWALVKLACAWIKQFCYRYTGQGLWIRAVCSYHSYTRPTNIKTICCSYHYNFHITFSLPGLSMVSGISYSRQSQIHHVITRGRAWPATTGLVKHVFSVPKTKRN